MSMENAQGLLRLVDCVRGSVVHAPVDIPVGRVAVVADPFENRLTLLDLSQGRYLTDADGTVTGVG
jgi:hypothetical protein